VEGENPQSADDIVSNLSGVGTDLSSLRALFLTSAVVLEQIS